MLSFFTVPDSANVIASSTDYASSFTTEFLPLIWVVVGITAAVVLVRFLMKLIRGGIKGAAGHGKRGGRRRRR